MISLLLIAALYSAVFVGFSEGNLVCTYMACSAPPLSPNCKNVVSFYPNGYPCEPSCRLCKDEHIKDDPSPPVWCTEIGCFDNIPRGCRYVEGVYPNGRHCGAACRKCSDDVYDVSQSSQICTEMGCIDNVPPGCKNVVDVYPNGRHCPPECKRCADDDQPIKVCTLRGCLDDVPPGCKNIVDVYPNGPDCPAGCKRCADPPKSCVGDSCHSRVNSSVDIRQSVVTVVVTVATCLVASILY